MQLKANERDQELRNDWVLNKLTKYTPEQFVFVDESAANERSAHRKQGWAPVGQVASQTTPLKRSERYSILPAYASDGFIDWMVIQGSFTTDLFKHFMEVIVLPHCNAFPGPKSVIIMDNAPIHRSDVPEFTIPF
jgi:DDE superfamily endonuclease